MKKINWRCLLGHDKRTSYTLAHYLDGEFVPKKKKVRCVRCKRVLKEEVK